MKISKYLIYALVSPINGEIIYIGRSSSGLARPKHHLGSSVLSKSKTKLSNKIREFISSGHIPSIEIIEETNLEEELNNLEKYYIDYYKNIEGHKLLNMTSGGSGTKGRKVSKETRHKMSLASRGRKNSLETRKKISLAKKGIKLDGEQLKKWKHVIDSLKKKVLCVTTGEVFSGIREAARHYNYDHRGIGRCCTGEYKQYKEKIWRFL
jgi:group I intron endonuclease